MWTLNKYLMTKETVLQVMMAAIIPTSEMNGGTEMNFLKPTWQVNHKMQLGRLNPWIVPGFLWF